MGDIMQTITAGQLAEKIGVSKPTMEKRVRRTFPDISPALSAPLSAEQVRVLSAGRVGKSVRKKTGTVRRSRAGNTMAAQGTTARPNEVAPPMAEKTPENPSADWMLDFINYFENAAAFTGFVLLFDWVGIAPGLICCAFYLHSMAVMKREGAWESAMLAKSICFVIAAVFGWVHFQTFTWALSEYRPDIEGAFWVSICGAALLSGISLTALYQSRNVKIDKQ